MLTDQKKMGWLAPFFLTKVIPHHPKDPLETVLSIPFDGVHHVLDDKEVRQLVLAKAKRDAAVMGFQDSKEFYKRVTQFYFVGRNVRAVLYDDFGKEFPCFVTDYMVQKMIFFNDSPPESLFPIRVRFFARDNDLSEEDRISQGVPNILYVFESSKQYINNEEQLRHFCYKVLKKFYEYLNQYTVSKLQYDKLKVVFDMYFSVLVEQDLYPDADLRVFKV